MLAAVDGQANQQLICDDYDHTSYVPSGMLVYAVSTLTGDRILQSARFIDHQDWSGSVLKYQEAAFLLDGLTRAGPSRAGDYQFALWHLFTPRAALPSSSALRLLNQAAAAAQGGELSEEFYSRLRVYTPTAAYASNQELLQWLPEMDDREPGGEDMATAEPGTWWLLAGGLLIGTSCGSKRLWSRHAAR